MGTDRDNPYAAQTEGEFPPGSQGPIVRGTPGPEPELTVLPVGRIRFFPIVLGFLVDLGLTFAASYGIASAATAYFPSPEELFLFYEGTASRYVFLPVGAACSLLGGFVTGVLARQREGLHVLGNVGLSILYGIWLIRDGAREAFDLHPWLSIAEYGSVIGAILLGGVLARRRRLRRAGLAPRHAGVTGP